jgi:hypothetical protein
MKKNSNNKNWRLLDATLNKREIARGNWKKKGIGLKSYSFRETSS